MNAPSAADIDPLQTIRLLQEELRETNREVLLLTLDLDKRVAERTAALRAAQEDLRRKHSELLQRSAQLEAANKELESFSYSVSHDLRAPLRHILGFVEALNEETAAGQFNDQARGFVAAIAKAAARMNTLIEELLEFSRAARAEMRLTLFDMGAVVNEAREETAADARGRNIQWQVEPLPAVRGDRSLLKQAWVNLLSNAIKYTRPRNPAIIKIGCADQGRRWEFYVQDNGVGFDMGHAEKLFGVFQRLHGADFEGAGVGLANVRQWIARHGGQTRAESKVDAGAAFYFTLPKDPQAATPTA